MNEEDLRRDRRSTRLSISIPVVLSGTDEHGNVFSESVRTLVVNRHGGKISTTHHLAMGHDVTIENRALGVTAKAHVVWLSKKDYPGGTHHVGLQLAEAQNVWGIAFPPDDWKDPREEVLPAPPSAPPIAPANPEAPVSSLAAEEITIRLLQELQESADAHEREFHDRLKALSHRLGLEVEFELRERAASARTTEVAALEDHIKALQGALKHAQVEIAALDAKIRELTHGVEAAAQSHQHDVTPLHDARRQLTAMTTAAVESMNRAAEEGLAQYRSLIEKENQEAAARLHAEAPEGERAKAAPES